MSEIESIMDYERDEARAWFNEAPAPEPVDLADYADLPVVRVTDVPLDNDVSDFAPPVLAAGYFPQRAHWYANGSWVTFGDMSDVPF